MYNRKQLQALLIPLIIEQLLNVLVGMADVLMVATLGEDAVAGVSLITSINTLILQVLFALSAGGTVVCAQFLGGKKQKDACRSGGQMFLITVFAMIVISLICILGDRAMLYAIFGQIEETVMDNAAIYMRLTAMSFPFLAIFQSGSAMFRAQGDTRKSMQISFIMNVINICGNAICIFGLHMGVEGVGIPTLVSRIVAAVSVLFLLQRKNNILRIPSFSYFLPNGGMIKRILAIGIPNSVESGIFEFGKVILQSLVSTLGTTSIAAFAVASNLVTYLYLPGNALGAGMLTIVGQCYGAGEYEQARYYAKKLVTYNYIMLIFLCAILIGGASFWVSCYQLSAPAAELARGLLISHCFAMTLWPIAFLYPYYFRAIGRASLTMVVAILTMWICRVGLAYVFIKIFHMNVLGIWYAMYVDWGVRVIVYLIALWREKKVGLQKPLPDSRGN
ncbi:MAG: MATE family efflux transporter [Lachnospiraceae bacterium]|nr:MATE family efflux transporter [Lachnospiraceae bacterium]